MPEWRKCNLHPDINPKHQWACPDCMEEFRTFARWIADSKPDINYASKMAEQLLKTELFKGKEPKFKLRKKSITVSNNKALEAFGLKLGKDKEGGSVRQPIEYIKNAYADLGEIIQDHATGLMWQKWHSETLLTYEDASCYITDLNSEHFGGYSDWRLPTIAELTSLLEPELQPNELYINPIFKTERSNELYYLCWSSDAHDSGAGMWVVTFYGDVYWNALHYSNLVRACRP